MLVESAAALRVGGHSDRPPVSD